MLLTIERVLLLKSVDIFADTQEAALASKNLMDAGARLRRYPDQDLERLIYVALRLPHVM